MKRITLLFLFLFSLINTQAAQPKLIVGLVIDQMRYDYLVRFASKYSKNGFARLMNQGVHCTNAHYGYVPTYTGPGHASIYTGTTPSVHGIIANDWFDRKEGAMVYCSEDKNVRTIGSDSKAGEMSPKRMQTSTIGDELKLFTHGKSKVIGLALKDRGAILPAGHSADGAYWFDDASGNFITSSFYRNDLPQWLIEFNGKKRTTHFLSQVWNTLLPIASYTESLPDNNAYEFVAKSETEPVFPHNLPEIVKANDNRLSIIKSTPFGNTLTKELMFAAIEGEQLGKDNITDLLCVSFSSPDYIGHAYGPRSVETQDCYLRLDLEIAEILNYLDKNIGKGQYLLFLTADHAASDNPNHLKSMRIPSGYLDLSKYKDSLNNYLLDFFPLNDPSERFVRAIVNEQVYLNTDLIRRKGFDKEAIEQKTAEFMRNIQGVGNVITRSDMLRTCFQHGVGKLLQAGFNELRSGDVIISLLPAWMDYGPKGTTHGTAYSYDTHVPILIHGQGILPQRITGRIDITQIAPGLCRYLDIPFPNGCFSDPIQEMLKGKK
ncbi:MAG: alkaline phosphatase PafA [Flavobacteriales bacterium]